ncbi:MAG: hypothetical protein OEV94_08420 [Deltaproteobacteria bacterium]|nr:hypothetical protein [Deltaproteobacteria bacterium]
MSANHAQILEMLPGSPASGPDPYRELFPRLAEGSLSRNRHPALFARPVYRAAHRRFRRLRAVAGLARLQTNDPHTWGRALPANTPGTDIQFVMEAPAQRFTRNVVLRDFEWRWLLGQAGVAELLSRPIPPSTRLP